MDREEAARLVERYSTAVYRLAYARTGSKEDAEDITQETFLRLVRAAPVFRDAKLYKGRKQTVKRAADNKRRYAPGEGSIPPVLLSGVSKGVPPLAHDFACKV